MTVGTWMYDHLPAMTRERDEKEANGALKKLLDVLGTSFDDLRTTADTLVTLVDVDTCPVEYLPKLAGLLGFEFPYDLEEQFQRNFVRSIVSLYRVKGTPAAMQFVVTRLIAGKGFSLEITNEDHVAKTYDVELTADDDTAVLNQLQNKIAYLVNLYSPAGMIPSILIVYYQSETIDSSRFDDAAHTTTEYTSWRSNRVEHRTNNNAETNAFGTQVLSI